ncbi:MAG: hypothetical protein AB1Z67_02455, partial [Candidatus Limnocylindrales bacterium]
MPPTRSRAAALTVATTLALVAGATAMPATAADSPEAAVNELLDAVEAADFGAVDTLVCEAERAAVRAQLDPAEAIGLDEARELITFRIGERAVEVTAEDGDTATVMLTGTMSMDVGEAEVEAVAMTLLEAEMGELSDEDLESMLPLFEMALSQTVPID